MSVQENCCVLCALSKETAVVQKRQQGPRCTSTMMWCCAQGWEKKNVSSKRQYTVEQRYLWTFSSWRMESSQFCCRFYGEVVHLLGYYFQWRINPHMLLWWVFGAAGGQTPATISLLLLLNLCIQSKLLSFSLQHQTSCLTRMLIWPSEHLGSSLPVVFL